MYKRQSQLHITSHFSLALGAVSAGLVQAVVCGSCPPRKPCVCVCVCVCVCARARARVCVCVCVFSVDLLAPEERHDIEHGIFKRVMQQVHTRWNFPLWPAHTYLAPLVLLVQLSILWQR